MLAIVIPYYNIIYFEETLKSLASQSDQRFKVYIGNDASPNNPEVVIEKYKQELNIIYKKFKENLGQTSLVQHWERCIALTSNEEWLMVLGDDDVLSDNYITQFYTNLQEVKQQNCQVIRFASKIIDANNKFISNKFIHSRLEKASDAFYRRFKEETRSSLSEYIFSRKAYDEYGFCEYSLGWHSDDMAWLQFTKEGNIYTINDSVAFIRISENSISGIGENFRLKQQAEYFFFRQLIKDKIKNFDSGQQLALVTYFKQLCLKRKELSVKNYLLISKRFLQQKAFFEYIQFSKKWLKK